METGKGRRPRRQTDHPQLKAEQGSRQHHPAQHRHRHRHSDTEMEARFRNQDRRRCRSTEDRGLGKAITFRIFPGAGHEIDQQQLRHIGQHQAGQDLAGIEPGSQQRWDCCPNHAAQQAHQHHRREGPPTTVLADMQREAAGEDGAQGELAFGADIPDIGAKAQRQADADQDQRRCLDAKLRQASGRDDRRHQEGIEGGAGIMPHEGENATRRDHGQNESQDRRCIGPEGGALPA